MTLQPAQRVYNFFGPIRVPNTIALRNSFCAAVNEGIDNLTVLFSSEGGSVEDGLSLFALIRALPFKQLHFHAVGRIASVAIPIFLAADIRTADPNAVFHFHEYDWSYGGPVTLLESRMAENLESLRDAARRASELVNARADIAQAGTSVAALFQSPHVFDAEKARLTRMVSDIYEYRVPDGVQMFNIGG